MQRTITGWRLDPAAHWVAQLDCGHGRHMRHAPPRAVRPWVTDAAARAARVGSPLDCVKCDRSEWPDGAEPYRSTAWFTHHTVPPGLLADHTTRAGTWGRIEVAEGRLGYEAGPPAEVHQVLDATHAGIVVPQHPHRVVLHGPVRFRVVFCRVPPT